MTYKEDEGVMAYVEIGKVLETARNGCHSDFGMSMADLTSLREVLEDTPTADVEEVKHGEWIIENSERDWKDKDTYRLSIKCSECGKVHFLGITKYQNEYDKEKLKKLGNYEDYAFCGKCGSKMDKKLGDTMYTVTEVAKMFSVSRQTVLK